MELVIEPYDDFPCELETFTINSKEASSIDFDDTFDHKKKKKILMAVIINTLNQSPQQR